MEPRDIPAFMRRNTGVPYCALRGLETGRYNRLKGEVQPASDLRDVIISTALPMDESVRPFFKSLLRGIRTSLALN
jgi:hypothetical protein